MLWLLVLFLPGCDTGREDRKLRVESFLWRVPFFCAVVWNQFLLFVFATLRIEDYVCLGSALPLSYSPVTEAITQWLHTVGRVHWHSFFLMNAFWRFSEVLCSYTTILQLHIKLFPPDHPPKSLSSPLSLLCLFFCVFEASPSLFRMKLSSGHLFLCCL